MIVSVLSASINPSYSFLASMTCLIRFSAFSEFKNVVHCFRYLATGLVTVILFFSHGICILRYAEAVRKYDLEATLYILSYSVLYIAGRPGILLGFKFLIIAPIKIKILYFCAIIYEETFVFLRHDPHQFQ